jgi:hypothetical protein
MLLETLVTLMLLATVVTAFLTLGSALTVSTAVHRDSVQAANLATSIAESMDELDYTSCGPSFSAAVYTDAPEVQSITGAMPARWKEPEFDIDFLQPTVSGVDEADFATCPAGGDRGVQRIRIRVESTAGRASGATITLLKRNDRCPPGAPTKVGEPC